jgi:replicative DNA helicase
MLDRSGPHGMRLVSTPLTASELAGIERRLLGAVQVGKDPERILEGLTPADFSHPGHRALFSFLRARKAAGLPFDSVSTLEALSGSASDVDDVIGKLGGWDQLAGLASSDALRLAGDAAEPYILTVKRYGCGRAILRAQEDFRAAHEAGDFERQAVTRGVLQRLLDRADRLEVGDPHAADPVLMNPADLWHMAMIRMGEDMAGKSTMGLTFGAAPLDGVLSPGLRPGRFWVIGAGTGEGKTILALMMALREARHGAGVLYLSWEMPGEELLERAAAMETSVPAWAIQKRQLKSSGEDHEALMGWTPPKGLLLPLVAGLQLRRIPRLVRDAKAHLRECGLELRLVVLDHLQLVRGSGKAETRALEVKEIADVAKQIALGGLGGAPLAVLGLSQLNRAREKDRPALWNLKDSGGIEEAADTVLLLSRSRDQQHRMTEEARVTIAKNRGGPVGMDVSLNLDERRLVFL